MSNPDDSRSAARARFLAEFAWHEGHADMWRVFEDADSWAVLVAGLAEPWSKAGITKVVGIESRGFLLGGCRRADTRCRLPCNPQDRRTLGRYKAE